MDDVASALHDALVAAYRPYLANVVAEHDVDAAVATGEEWLSVTLQALLEEPFPLQRRAPLEVFREALRFPTQALSDLGVPVSVRPELEERVLPGDLYGLSPASAQDLGEEVWAASIAWGAQKAEVARTIGWLGRDLSDRAKIEAAAETLGRRLVQLPGDVAACGAVVIDLTFPQAFDVLDDAAELGLPALAYGPHVDRSTLDEATSRGAVALARSKFFTDPASFLST